MTNREIYLAILIMMIAPSIQVIQNKRLKDVLEYETALRTILHLCPQLSMDDNYVVCICPHCKKRFTCLGNITCIHCYQPFGLTYAEARYVGLSSRKIPESTYIRLIH